MGSRAVSELLHVRLQRLGTCLDFEVRSLRLHEIRVGIIPTSIVVPKVSASRLLNKIVGLELLGWACIFLLFFKQRFFLRFRLLQKVSLARAAAIVAKIKSVG